MNAPSPKSNPPNLIMKREKMFFYNGNLGSAVKSVLIQEQTGPEGGGSFRREVPQHLAPAMPLSTVHQIKEKTLEVSEIRSKITYSIVFLL